MLAERALRPGHCLRALMTYPPVGLMAAGLMVMGVPVALTGYGAGPWLLQGP